MSTYKFEEINSKHREKMHNSIQNIKVHFEWENDNLLEYFAGALPGIRPTSEDKDSLNTQLYELNTVYNSYDYFTTDKNSFLQEIENKLAAIHEINHHWYGLSLDTVKYYTDLHHACILIGEGGIGKSYFIYQLEKEISKKNISHLCFYGKYQESAMNIDFEEILLFSKTNPFIFIIDAFNELTEENKTLILTHLPVLLQNKNIRVIITYRTYALSKDYAQKLLDLIQTRLSFPGISFESALDVISKYPIKDVYKYSDILFSNNALLISKLIKILTELPEDRNSVCSVTYILEHDFIETIGKDYWRQTKNITEWMYNHNSKEIPFSEISNCIKNANIYIEKLVAASFIYTYSLNGEVYIGFQIESVHDYLIARFLFNNIDGKTDEKIISLLIEKLNTFTSAREAFILTLFDKFEGNYERIYRILERSKLLEELEPETIRKINFKSVNIPAFLSVFTPEYPIQQLLYFAGFVNKPFNCINYQNKILFESEVKQLVDLSKCLTNNFETNNLARRLKNILYLINYTGVEDSALEEYFFTSLWCSAAPNTTVRILAKKLLFDIVQINKKYIDTLIEIFPKIVDYFIQDSVLEVLFYHKNNFSISCFFNKLKDDFYFLSAKNNARIANYLDKPEDYINWEKHNLFKRATKKISSDFESLLSFIDLYDKNILHFRYWDINRIDQMYPSFFYKDKKELKELNNELSQNFICVKTGECNGWMPFEDKIKKIYKFDIIYFPVNSFLKSFESVFNNIFQKYNYNLKEDEQNRRYNWSFQNSLLHKLTLISQDIFYGSLMCNYFTTDFSSFNDPEDMIGYKVYNPLQYETEYNLTAPIPTYNTSIERMQEKALKSIDYSMTKDGIWVKNAELSRNNVLSIINTSIWDNKKEWILLCAKISLKESSKETSWQDNYDISCCSSSDITIEGDENDRYLTIEHKDYYGLIDNYRIESPNPNLCMDVKQIASGNSLLDETNLLLPPATLIRDLDLSPDLKTLSWINKENDEVIRCNNNKSSYYHDLMNKSVFIRKDIYEEYIKTHTLKYFVFTERLIPEHGFDDDTCFNMEIENGEIIKEFLHFKTNRINTSSEEVRCNACSIGLDKEHERIRNNPFDISKLIDCDLNMDIFLNGGNIEINSEDKE